MCDLHLKYVEVVKVEPEVGGMNTPRLLVAPSGLRYDNAVALWLDRDKAVLPVVGNKGFVGFVVLFLAVAHIVDDIVTVEDSMVSPQDTVQDIQVQDSGVRT